MNAIQQLLGVNFLKGFCSRILVLTDAFTVKAEALQLVAALSQLQVMMGLCVCMMWILKTNCEQTLFDNKN